MTITLDATSLYSGKGFNVQDMVKQVLDAQRAQENQWKAQQTALQKQQAALNEIQNQLATFYTKSTSLTDFGGVFAMKSASSSDTGILLATADTSASTGRHVIRVENLATTGSAYSTALADDTVLEAGSLTLTVGGTSHTVDLGTTNTSLASVADAINKLQMGVTAAVQHDASGNRLTLLSDVSGAAGALAVTGGTSQLSFTVQQGKDAIVQIDGVPFQSPTNTVQGRFPGVTLTLSSAAPNTDVILNVSPDVSQAAQAVSDWVDAYNTLVGSVNAQFTYDASTETSGALAGDSSVRMLQESLLKLVAFSGDASGSGSLRNIGIQMKDDGTLSVNTSTLNDVLANHFDTLTSFFQASGSFGETLGTTALQLNSPTQGAIALDLRSMQQTGQDLKNEIDDFEARLTSQQQTLLLKYSAINATLQSLPSLQNQLSAVLNSFSNSSSSK